LRVGVSSEPFLKLPVAPILWFGRNILSATADPPARLNAPTPWSRRMMPNLQNFARGGGRMVASSAIGQGGIVSALPIGSPLPRDREPLAPRLSQIDSLLSFGSSRRTRPKRRSRPTKRAGEAERAPLYRLFFSLDHWLVAAA
jgi:hypothetical protein